MLDTAEPDGHRPNFEEINSGKRASPDRSTISFPYTHLEDASTVVMAIHQNGPRLTRNKLADILRLPPHSGSFSIKTNSARIFGLIENIDGQFGLTTLGELSLSANQNHVQLARKKAFLNIELYKKLFDSYEGKPLPSRPTALEDVFASYGVTPKQKDKARLAFERSAQFAGFFHAGRERLVEPVLADSTHQNDYSGSKNNIENVKDTNVLPSAAHQLLVMGLLERLPPPDTSWPVHERIRWLRAFAVNLSIVYGQEGEADILVDIAGVSPRPSTKTAHAQPAASAKEEKHSAHNKATPSRGWDNGGDLDEEIPF